MGIHLHNKSNIKDKKPNVAVVTWPIHKSGVVSLQNLVNIVSPLSNEVHIITGAAGTNILIQTNTKTNLRSIKYKITKNTILRIINNAIIQVKVSWQLLKIIRKVDFYIFFLGGTLLLLPMLTAKLCRKKVVLILTGSDAEEARMQFGDLIAQQVRLMIKINYVLSNRIIVCSKNLIGEWRLVKYKDKISIAHHHVLDLNQFKIYKPLKNRHNTVGYIGRLIKEKGILNFIAAIHGVLKEEDEIRFVIGGDGQLINEIEHYLDENKLDHNVKLLGWITHDELPRYLNELQLLVLPSYTEGLPNIILEAMACGTPILTTPVGAIPDIIKEGQTGFIMDNNSPECISKNIIRARRHPGLDQISCTARELVETEFTIRKTNEMYRKIFCEQYKRREYE